MDPEVRAMKNLIKLAVGVVVLIFILVALTKSYHIVPPGHRGVAVTLGSVQTDMRGEGITAKLPFFTNITDVPIKQITHKTQAVCFSSDLQTVVIGVEVLYRLPESKVVTLFQSYAGDPYVSLVEPRVQEALKKAASEYRAEEIVKKRPAIKAEVAPMLKSAIGDLVEIVEVVLTNVDLTKELEHAIELKQVMEQQALAKEYEFKKAQKEAEITIVGAKAEAESVRIKGEALKSSPQVIELEIVKKWNGICPTFVSTNAGGANVLLPLK